MKKILLLLAAYFSLSLTATAQMAPDLDTLGNVWIVTVDHSGSMLKLSNGSTVTHTPQMLASEVRDRMRRMDFMQDIDYRHDRFIFYKSGVSVDYSKGFGNEMAIMPDLDTSFIHHTDAGLHKFQDHNAMLQHLYELMRVGRYDHDLSFVSQIRTFSVVKTVKFLKDAGQEADFDSFKLITITDDADQDDKWRNDYKNLSVADKINRGRKPISQRTKETIQQYVFNDLTSVGAGAFREVFADDSKMPHIWVYDYVTLQSMSDTLRRNVLRVEGNDGKHMTFVPKHIYHGEDELCFYGVDSVVVNGEAHVIGKNFNKRYEASFPYRNGLRFNDVKVYGSVQFKYEDDIYGPHYKKVRFIQEQKLPSGIWAFIFTVLGILAGVTVLGYLTYRLIILPRRTMATLYSGNGSRIQLKRGFRFQWKNEVTPIALYEADASGIRSVLVRKHRNVIDAAQEALGEESSLLICSRVRLNVSDVDLEHSTFDDIDATYVFRQLHYPELLKNVYRQTLISKARRSLVSSHLPLMRRFYTRVIAFLQKVTPMYYYYYNDVTKYDSVCLESPKLLVDKKFIIETAKGAQVYSMERHETVVNKALSIYYFDVKKSYHDALLCYDVIDGKEYWNIVLLDDPTALHNGLKNVSVIYRFVCDADPANKAVKEKALYNYARRRLRRYSLGILDCSGVQPSQTTAFNITSVPVPGFVSFLEFKVKPRAQMIYSPFQDGFIQYKFVSVKSTYDEGHLYLSFLPYKFVREGGKLQDPDGQMLVRMSDELVRPQDMSAARMYLRHDEVTYRGINVKLNK